MTRRNARYSDCKFTPANDTARSGPSQAGQERYRSLSTSFYRGTHAVIFVYDICSRASFLDFHRWMAEAEQLTVPNTIFYIVRIHLSPNILQCTPPPLPFLTYLCFQVGSKLDKAETGRAVTAEEGAALAKKRGAGFCELSSQTGEDVRELFLEVVKLVVQSPELMAAVAAGKTPGTIAMSVGQPEGSSGCWC